MGRGRAKAKQIKVARKLKYNSGPSTDLTALERELHASSGDSFHVHDDQVDDIDAVDDDDDEDPYAAYAADDDEGDDYSGWAASGR